MTKMSRTLLLLSMLTVFAGAFAHASGGSKTVVVTSSTSSHSDEAVLRGLYACNKLLAASTDTDLSDASLQAALTQVFLLEFPLFTTVRFNEVLVSKASIQPRVQRGEYRDDEPDVGTLKGIHLEEKHLKDPTSDAVAVSAEATWATVYKEIVAGDDWIPTDQLYQLGYEDTEQLKLILRRVEESPRLRAGMVQLIEKIYREQLAALRLQNLSGKLVRDAKDGWAAKWDAGGIVPARSLVSIVALGAPIGAGVAAVFTGLPVLADVAIVSGGAVAPLLWYGKELKNYFKGKWASFSGSSRKKQALKNLARFSVEQAAKPKALAAPIEVAVEQKEAPQTNFGEWSGSLKETEAFESRFRQFTPALPDLNFKSIDAFGLGIFQEQARLLVFNSELRDKYRDPEVWKTKGLLKDRRRILGLTEAYARGLNELLFQYDEGMATYAAHFAYLKTDELKARVEAEAAKTGNPEALVKRLEAALLKAEAKLQRNQAELEQLRSSFEAELKLMAVIEERVNAISADASDEDPTRIALCEAVELNFNTGKIEWKEKPKRGTRGAGPR